MPPLKRLSTKIELPLGETDFVELLKYGDMRRVVRFFAAISAVAILASCSDGQDKSTSKFESLSASQFALVVEDSAHCQIVDVRTAEEFAAGHLPNAVNIDIHRADFEQECRSRLKTCQTIAVYCRSGKRSKIAAGRLASIGFRVKEMDGGVMAWEGPLTK